MACWLLLSLRWDIGNLKCFVNAKRLKNAVAISINNVIAPGAFCVSKVSKATVAISINNVIARKAIWLTVAISILIKDTLVQRGLPHCRLRD